MNLKPPPFEQGRSLHSQLTARRLNDLERGIPRIRFSGGGARVSHLGDQVLVTLPRTNPAAAFKAPLQPGSDVSTPGSPMYTITYGTYGGFTPTIDGTPLVPMTAANIITLGAMDISVYMQCDFTYGETSGVVTIVDAQIHSTASTVPASTISAGSGTLYQQLFGVTINPGPRTFIIAAPAVGGSQNFGVCLAGPSISGPWGV